MGRSVTQAGDGDLDLVETPGTIMLNLGGGAFGAPQSYLYRWQGPQYWDSGVPEVQVADLDRDGDPDITSSGIILTNTTRQIARGAIPRPGRPASVDLYGTPGGAWFLFGSSATTSIPLPPWGTVLIDPAFAQLPAVGTFVATGFLAGTATLGVTLPPNPGLIGATAYLQAIDAAQMRLTNRLTLTVMGY